MNEIFEQFNIWAGIDILIIAYIIYHILLLVRGTRAAQMLTGILIVVAAFLLSNIVPLTTLNWVMNKFYSSFFIILVILFQDDIRLALSRIGKKSILSTAESISSNYILDEITRSATALAAKKIGALIVIERNILLARYVDIGITVDAKISKDLLLSIFHTTSPIHDGAIIIQKGRVSAAGCFLPLAKEQNLDHNMGTRHRAALGISQETDAVVVLVSEEDRSISLVVDGEFDEKLEASQLRRGLRKHLVDELQYSEVTDIKDAKKKKTVKEKIQKLKNS